jgi:hypothetical protein
VLSHDESIASIGASAARSLDTASVLPA